MKRSCNYREVKSCGNCQFVMDTLFGYIRCSHKGNSNLSISENGICDHYTEPYTIDEQKFKKLLSKEFQHGNK